MNTETQPSCDTCPHRSQECDALDPQICVHRKKWEREQQARARQEREKDAKTLHQICFVQRISESRKTASQIVIASPYEWKNTAWRNVRKYLMTGAWC